MAITVNKIHTLTGHNDCVYTVVPAGDDQHIFTAAGDGMVAVWDLHHPGDGYLIAKVPNSVYALHHHPSGVLIAGQNYEGIHILDWKNKKELGSLKLGPAAIFDITSVGNEVWVAGGDGVVRVISLDDLLILKTIRLSEARIRSLAIHPFNGTVAVGSSDFMIRILDLETGAIKKEWRAHTNSVFTVRYSPDGKTLLSAGRDARLKAWAVDDDYSETGSVVAHLYAINSIDFDTEGKYFVTCSLDKSIKVWAGESLRLLKVIDRSRHAGHGTSVNKVLWTGTGNKIISASDDRTVSIWEIIF